MQDVAGNCLGRNVGKPTGISASFSSKGLDVEVKLAGNACLGAVWCLF